MTIVLLDREINGHNGPNFDEFILRMKLEEKRQKVISVHFDANNPPQLKTIGRDTFLEFGGCEVNASPFLREGRDSPFAPFLLEMLEQRMKAPATGLRVEKRGDDFYLMYPPGRIHVNQVKGAVCLASNIGVEPASDKALDVLGVLEKSGAVTLNSRKSIETSNSKIRSQKAFEEHGVPVPHTLCIPSDEPFNESEVRAALKQFSMASFVVKGEHGYQGRSLYYAASEDEAVEATKAILETGNGVVLQEEIPLPPGGERRFSIRATVLDGKIVGAIGRMLRKGERDISGIPPTLLLSPAQQQAAIAASTAAGQGIGGVDLGGTEDKPIVFETNEALSFLPHEQVGQKVADAAAAFLIARIKQAEKEAGIRLSA